jgi:DNA-binding CsgD family transcriptional regulator
MLKSHATIKLVTLYGLVMAVGALGLTWLDYKFWMRDIGPEIFLIVMALFFGCLGLWFGRHFANIETRDSGSNDKAIRALGLTPREIDMLRYLQTGKSNKEIARELGVSPNTVKTHLANLYVKLGVRNRTEAVSRSIELSL